MLGMMIYVVLNFSVLILQNKRSSSAIGNGMKKYIAETIVYETLYFSGGYLNLNTNLEETFSTFNPKNIL
jgi:hypothetical protein